MSNLWESFDSSNQSWAQQPERSGQAAPARTGRKAPRYQESRTVEQPRAQKEQPSQGETLQQSTFADLAPNADVGRANPWLEFGMDLTAEGETGAIPASGFGIDPNPIHEITPARPASALLREATGAAFAGPRVDPHTVWQMALAELALQMTTATYDTWVRDTAIMAYEDGEFIIGAPNSYVRDWLDNRLRATIKRTLGGIMRRSVQVNFRVKPQPAEDTVLTDETPLYQASQSAQPVQPARSDAAAASAPRAITYPTMTQPASQTSVPLNIHHTFETFVVGNHNRLAHAAARAVAEQPGQRFNPLFIYGGVGLGKTHLLHALGNEAAKRNLNVLYCTSEQFTNDLISAIRNQNTEEFRNKYRQLDVLLIDDIQFIGGKESTQEEFFHTFNHLHSANRQVVISSDRSPKAIATLEGRLRSRFEGGLQADISQPDFETRVAILQAKAAELNVPIPLDVLMIVAERVESNIRELEGALNRLVMQARLINSPLDRQLAETVLNDLAPQRTPREPTTVVRVVAEHFRLKVEDLTGRTRTKEIANARQVAMYLLREENDMSLPMIGDLLGGRDHSTVRYGVDKVAVEMESNDSLRRDILLLRERIYAGPGSA